MPGKRPRQIKKTSSLLQLCGSGMAAGARFSRAAPESVYGAPLRGLSVPLKEELEAMEFCTGTEESVAMEDNFSSMSVDGSMEEIPFVSHDRPRDLHEAPLPTAHNSEHLGPPHHSLHPSYFAHAPHNRPMPAQASFCRSQEPSRSAQATHFLDVCFLCSKKLGHGRDVFIYRGDRAFCSVECRHSQIVADEMRDNCGMAAAKEGSSDTPTNNSTTTKQVETAAAA